MRLGYADGVAAHCENRCAHLPGRAERGEAAPVLTTEGKTYRVWSASPWTRWSVDGQTRPGDPPWATWGARHPLVPVRTRPVEEWADAAQTSNYEIVTRTHFVP